MGPAAGARRRSRAISSGGAEPAARVGLWRTLRQTGGLEHLAAVGPSRWPGRFVADAPPDRRSRALGGGGAEPVAGSVCGGRSARPAVSSTWRRWGRAGGRVGLWRTLRQTGGPRFHESTIRSSWVRRSPSLGPRLASGFGSKRAGSSWVSGCVRGGAGASRDAAKTDPAAGSRFKGSGMVGLDCLLAWLAWIAGLSRLGGGWRRWGRAGGRVGLWRTLRQTGGLEHLAAVGPSRWPGRFVADAPPDRRSAIS